MPPALIKPSKHSTALSELCRLAVKVGLWGSAARMQTYLDYLFAGVPLAGSRFLDVGGGVGLFCAAAKALGAAHAVCLEPGGVGADDTIKEASKAAAPPLLQGGQFDFVPSTLEEFLRTKSTSHSYDVILLHNVINHLDEAACIRLHHDEDARRKYAEKIRLLSGLAAPGAMLIVCDCARNNFFPDLGFKRNPVNRFIEWHKHQNPAVWRALFAADGWQHQSTQWTTPNTLGSVGRLLGNRVCSYFLLGHFRLVMTRSVSPGADI